MGMKNPPVPTSRRSADGSIVPPPKQRSWRYSFQDTPGFNCSIWSLRLAASLIVRKYTANGVDIQGRVESVGV